MTKKIDRISDTFLKKEAMLKYLSIVSLIILVFTLAGCTAQRKTMSLDKLSDEQIEAYNSAPNRTSKIVCETEKPVGSIIPKRVCHLEYKTEERAQRDQQGLRNIQNKGIPEPPKGGR